MAIKFFDSLNVTGTTDSYFLGKVGIGTTNPALQSGGTGLHINAPTSSELKFTNNTTGSGAADGTALVSTSNNFTIYLLEHQIPLECISKQAAT